MKTERETPLGPVENSDGSMENFYRLFKFGFPKGSITMYQKWMRELAELQKTVHICPWCGTQGELIVNVYNFESDFPEGDLRYETGKVIDPDGLRYSLECKNEECPVTPKTNALYKTPEQAIEVWNGRH